MYKIIAVRKVTFNDDVKFKDPSRSTSPVGIQASADPIKEQTASRVVSRGHSRLLKVIPLDVSDSSDAPSEVLPKATFVIPDFSKHFPLIYKSCSYAPVFGKKGNHIDDLIAVLTNAEFDKAEKLVRLIEDRVSSNPIFKLVGLLFLNDIYRIRDHFCGLTV